MTLFRALTKLDDRVLPSRRGAPSDRRFFGTLIVGQVLAAGLLILGLYNHRFAGAALPPIGVTILLLAQRLPARNK